MQTKLLSIASGCIEFRLKILSYAALLNLSLLYERGASEGIKHLPPLHQKLQDGLREEFPRATRATAIFSFTNHFKGGSYRSALEFFCGGFAIDDMLPIIKKQIKFHNIDYLCIDMKTAPQTTLNDLKREFKKGYHRKLKKLKRKVLKGKTLSPCDCKLILKLIEAGKKQDKNSRKDITRELAANKIKKVTQKAESLEKKQMKTQNLETLERKELSENLEVPGKKEKVMQGLENLGIKMKRIQDLETLGKKIQDFETPGKKIQDFAILRKTGKKIQDFETPGRKIQDFTIPRKKRKKIQDFETPGKKIQDFETPGKKIQDFTIPGKKRKKFQDFETPGKKIQAFTIPGKKRKKIQDFEIPGKKIQDFEIPGKKIQDFETPGKKIQDFTIPGKKRKKIQDFETPGKKIQDFETPGKKIQAFAIPGKKRKKIQDFEIPGKKIQDFEIPGKKIQDFETPGKKIQAFAIPWRKRKKVQDFETPGTKIQKTQFPAMKEKEVTQLKSKAASLQTKRSKRKDLDRIVTIQQLKRLARNLGPKWKNLATEGMGMSENVVEQLELDLTDLKDRALEILMVWKKQEKYNPTRKNLIGLLKKANVSTDLWEFLNPEIDAFKVAPVTNKSSKSEQETEREPKAARAEKQVKTFEVVLLCLLRKKPKKCYGCSKQLLDGEGDPDLILRTKDVREFYGPCGNRRLAFQESNVYFHLFEKCVEKKYGLFNHHNFIVPNDVLNRLTSIQLTTLKSMNIIHDTGDTKSQNKIEEVDFWHANPAQHLTDPPTPRRVTPPPMTDPG
ncbi:uncharacterized protein [Heptranchias perlo]|uniref:uncharacterized protein n=1 Tax=Heptranchias perlo TaxID=212740 RepID=UPI0035598DAC